MFNSREYEWSDLTIVSRAKIITEATGIKYSRKIEREAIYAKGRNAISVQSGNESIEGELTLLQSGYEAMVAASNGDIFKTTMDLLISYGNPCSGGRLINDRIIGIFFTEEAKDWKQGDKFKEITLPFIALQIQRHV